MVKDIYGGNVREQVAEEKRGLDMTEDQSVVLNTKGLSQLEVKASSDVVTNFFVDFSNTGEDGDWIEGEYIFEAVKGVSEGYFNTYPYVRLRSTANGSQGDTVTLRLMAGGN